MTAGLTPTIWTLNARDNIVLDVLSSYLGPPSAWMRRAIVTSHRELLSILVSKNIDYRKLRAALVPQVRRQDAPLCSIA